MDDFPSRVELLDECYAWGVETYEARLREMTLAATWRLARFPAVITIEDDAIWMATCDPSVTHRELGIPDPGRPDGDAIEQSRIAYESWCRRFPYEPFDALLVLAPVDDAMHVRISRITNEERDAFRRRLSVGLDGKGPPAGR